MNSNTNNTNEISEEPKEIKTIFIDKALKSYILPLEMRDNSISEGKVFTPGTRIKIPEEAKFIRLFTAWGSKKGPAGFDIDLSSAFVKETDKGYEMTPVAFYNQTEKYAVSSGDQVSCEEYNEGDTSITAEFIDIDIEKARKGYDFALTSNIIFSSNNLTHDYDTDINAYSGVILLDELRTSPKTSININDALFKMKLSGDFTTHTAVAVDFKTREIVIIDKYSKERKYMTLDNSFANMDIMRKKYFDATSFMENVYSVLKMYAKANNLKVVKTIEEADVVCSYNDYKLREDQKMFNVGTNITEVLNLLN
jgi:hypothetical protein